MAGMMDILIHEYFGVGIGLVWRVTVSDIPKLQPQIDTVLKSVQQQ